MLVAQRTTLTQYLIEWRRSYPDATGDFNELLLQVSQACKAIGRAVAHGQLRGVLGSAETVNVQGEEQKKLDVLANELFVRTTEWTGVVCGLASEEMEEPLRVGEPALRGRYLLVFDPLDGSSNIDVNVAVGSIFSVLLAPDGCENPSADDFLQPGSAQVAAGYAIYGPSTMLVLTVGEGVVGFTLDPELGEFFLTHPDIRVPEETREFAINASNSRFWEAPVKRYVEECLAGHTGPRGKDFNMRWIASLVAEAHRILTRGGVFLYPRDTKQPSRPGRLRLLYECNPVGMIVENAGGRASTGEGPVLDVVPTDLHERVGFVFGSREEVDVIERYHAEYRDYTTLPSYGSYYSVEEAPEFETPLFNRRGLFRQP